MRVLLLALTLIIGTTIGATGIAQAKSCYSSAEAEAENAIRIHSELMVIGLNCQHMTPRGWQNFYSQYREFTSRHQDLFSNYEARLIKANGGSERKIHDMRTSFANQTSADVAKMRPDVFCANFAPRIPKVANMSRAELQDWVSTSSNRPTKPICR
jgi:hypothetical protein